MVDFKITKTKLLKEHNTDMAHNYYFLIQGRLYNEDKTRYRKFKFVQMVDIFDVQEYFDIEWVNIKDAKECALEFACSLIEMVNDYNDKKNLHYFYEMCNETIENWNKLACYWNW